MKQKKYNILSFIIPVIIMILLYMSVGVIGGNKNILTVDLANQYVEFFGALKDVLSGVTSPFYTFSKTLGGNFFGIMTYYLLSPLNVILVLFNKIDIPKFILIINVIKIGLTGLTSYIYFNKKFKESKLSLLFSITYSLMAYNIAYSQNIMWLDGVIMLPIIFLGIDKLLEQKPLLFYTSLTLSIIFNYYIGYMSCIASLLYYIYELYIKEQKIEIKKIIYCIKYILISVLTAGVVLIPSIFSLMQGKANGLLGDFVPNQRFAILDLITRFYIGTFKNSDILGTLPNLYISQIMIVLVIYYFFNKNIKEKEKYASLILIGLFALGFVFSPINTIWHTLKNPVGFPFRYSFMFDMILLIIAYKSILNIKEIDKKFIKNFIFYSILISLVLDKLLYTKTMYYKILGTSILQIFYLIYLSKNKKQVKNYIMILLTLEMFLNGFTTVYNIKYQNKEKYNKFMNETGNIIDNIKDKDNSFYRLEKDYSYSSNDELLLNYNGISHFSSVYEGKTNELLGKYLGIFNRFYVTNYYGSTLVTNSLFDIKYLLSKNELEYYKKIDKKNKINIYENQYNLPLGFMVNEDLEKLELKKYKPFENQNNILKTMNKNIEDVFYKNNYQIEFINLKQDETKEKTTYKKINNEQPASIKIKLTAENEGILYGYMSCEKFKKVDVLLNGKSIIDITDENGYEANILELGRHNINDQIELEFLLLEDNIQPKEIMFYTLNLEKFENAINLLNKEKLEIVEYNKDYIKTTVTVEENNMLYTSIPYDKGFEIIVDGKKQEPIKAFDTLISLKLDKGKHTIEFKYQPRGLKEGTIISLIGIILFIITKKREH